MRFSYYDIPGYTEAVEREKNIRELPCVGVTETIAGIEVVSMTARHFLMLEGAGNAFVTGGQVDAHDIPQFLWVLSPRFGFQNKRDRKRLIKRVRRLNVVAAIEAIDKYLEETFWDAPSGTSSKASFIGWGAHIIHLIASNYHWSADQCLDHPLKLVWQYYRAIQRDSTDSTPPNRSDKIVTDYFQRGEPEHN